MGMDIMQLWNGKAGTCIRFDLNSTEMKNVGSGNGNTQ